MRRKRSRKQTVPAASRRGAIPPLKDSAEAVERIVPRRLLRLEPGDVLIVRTATGFRVGQRDVYELRDASGGGRPERFASFERAATAGEQIATARRSRLYYTDFEDEPPHLLSDFRDR